MFPVLAALTLIAAFLFDKFIPLSSSSTNGKRGPLSINADDGNGSYKQFGAGGLSDFEEARAGERLDGTVTRTRQDELDRAEMRDDDDDDDDEGGTGLAAVLGRHRAERAKMEVRQQGEIATLLGSTRA
jgi:hypothetical protein